MHGRKISLYVHIPFCQSFCDYCSFPRIILSEPAILADYLKALEAELHSLRNFLGARTVGTVYIGGGTPSAGGSEFVRRLVDLLVEQVDLTGTQEFTVECNPDDLNSSWAFLRDSPVTRISLGVQTFQDPRSIGRRHTSEQARQAVRMLQDMGMGNISLDLIFGLPSSSIHTMEEDIREAHGLHPRHISFYGLSVDEGTKLHRRVCAGEIKVPDEEKWIGQMEAGRRLLDDLGYKQYEISNFSIPGYESIHNLSYWTGGDYIGIGSGAASRAGCYRWYNPFPPDCYLNLDFSPWESFPPWAEEVEIITPQLLQNEMIMTGLRLKKGIPLESFQSGEHIEEALRTFLASGHLEIENGRYRLTDRGVLVSDGIFSDLFATIDDTDLSLT
ncbi:radical SAM family heme chaperone HemW [Myxococcota bacterium]|nr:radical SAM family heme chaperone HemW [Myxococcota bacterium]